MRSHVVRIALALIALSLCAVSMAAQSAPPTLISLAVSPSSVTGGNSTTGTVTLSASALGDGALVMLSSGNPAAAIVPQSVLIKGGSKTASFPIGTRPVQAQTVVGIAGVYRQVTQSARLIVLPAPPSTGQITGVVFRDGNGNGRLDPGEAVVSGATVELWNTTSFTGVPQRLQSQQTNGQGRYQFKAMSLSGPIPDFGCYQVRVTRPADLGGGVVSSPQICQVSPGGTINFDFPLRGPISQQVRAEITTDRGSLQKGQNARFQVGDRIQILFRIDTDGTQQIDATIEDIPPGGQSRVIFRSTVPSNQTFALNSTITPPLGTEKVRLTAVGFQGQVTARDEASFIVESAPAPPGRVQRLLSVGDPVPAAGRLGIFGADPVDQDKNVSAIRRMADDGSVFVADYAGAALLRFGTGIPQVASASRGAASGQATVLQASAGSPILLDTTAQDPVDKVGLARILRVETGRDGTSAVLALRADNTRAIYRLDKSGLTRLALLTGATGPAELAIGDAGQIAYTAPLNPTPSSPLALLQVVGGQNPTELVYQTQVIQSTVLGALNVVGFSSLQSNGAGDLTYLLDLRRADGTPVRAVMRKTSAGNSSVAVSGRVVARGRGAGVSGALNDFRQPRIGPDGTVVFLGRGDGLVNFYVDGPGRPVQPLLRDDNWNPADDTYDYEIAANGAVALRAALGQATESALSVMAPNGAVAEVAKASDRIQPIGKPVFVPGGNESLFFFLAKNLDRPLDRNDRVPVVLCRSRLVNGQAQVDAVAAPGQPVPRKPGHQLLTITQRPVVSGKEIVFGALYGGTGSRPVPTAGLFRVPLNGTLDNSTLLAAEGDDLPGGNRVAMLRELNYMSDGTLLFNGLLPGAGPIVASAVGAATTAAVVRIPAAPAGTERAARTQSTQATSVTPLVAIGQPLDRPDRRLLAILGRLVALRPNRQLLVARFSVDGGSPGEGLFSVGRDGSIQAVAVTDDPAPGLAGARFAAFGDTAAYTLSPPAVSVDGNVVFKARLKLLDGTASDGVFQWTGTAITAVGLAQPNPDNLALSADDRPPYDLTRWAAGASGRAYLMERHQTRSSAQVARLFEHTPAGLSPLIGGSPSPLANLFDLVCAGDGSVFVSGTAANSSGLFRAEPGPLASLVKQGDPLPRFADGNGITGRFFDGTFTLMPDSTLGSLLFRAGAVPQPGAAPVQGLFSFGPLGLQTLQVEGLGVAGARDVSISTLATAPAHQTINGTTASATLDSGGHWQIWRSRAVVNSQGKVTFSTDLVAQEGKPLPGGATAVSLDPGPVLDLPAGSGPVFTLNDAGDVAFLASDGQRWGIYLFSNR